jgi:hypothetical protein
VTARGSDVTRFAELLQIDADLYGIEQRLTALGLEGGHASIVAVRALIATAADGIQDPVYKVLGAQRSRQSAPARPNARLSSRRAQTA